MTYPPEIFLENNRAALIELMLEYPLATLVVPAGSALNACCHVPLLVREHVDGTLLLEGHVSSYNPLAYAGGQVFAIFHGPQHYISPSWYQSKAQRPVVPTWDYAAVHVQAELLTIPDPAWLHSHLSALTEQMERDMQEPWRIEELPPDAMQQALAALVGLQLRVTAMRGISKLSQNKSLTDRLGVKRGLAAVGSAAADALAAWIDVNDPS